MILFNLLKLTIKVYYSEKERVAFVEAISVITKAYDKLFNCSFPCPNGIHQALTNTKKHRHWH